ncbi:uncharacterized protein LOC142639801 [Castanea sativa]|uniref:uncharacterized protein LOC142639801 n=1 Tax=Castanea sativa TaxID=21020 RepID=UPI003F64978C
MLEALSGRTLSADLKFLRYLCLIMDDNSTTRTLGNSVSSWESRITTPYLPTHKPEVANQSLMKIIKTRLEEAKRIWPDELSSVLWAYRMRVRTLTREASFKLAYGSDVVIPTEVGLTSYRVAHFKDVENEKQLQLSLDLIDKVRMDVEQRVACYKNLMIKHQDAMVKPKQFKIGDLILKKVSLKTKNPAHGKLGPNWKDHTGSSTIKDKDHTI